MLVSSTDQQLATAESLAGQLHDWNTRRSRKSTVFEVVMFLLYIIQALNTTLGASLAQWSPCHPPLNSPCFLSLCIGAHGVDQTSNPLSLSSNQKTEQLLEVQRAKVESENFKTACCVCFWFSWFTYRLNRLQNLCASNWSWFLHLTG